LRSQDFENGTLLRSGKTLQVYTGQRVCRLPLLAEHKADAQQGKKQDSREKTAHLFIVGPALERLLFPRADQERPADITVRHSRPADLLAKPIAAFFGGQTEFESKRQNAAIHGS